MFWNDKTFWVGIEFKKKNRLKNYSYRLMYTVFLFYVGVSFEFYSKSPAKRLDQDEDIFTVERFKTQTVLSLPAGRTHNVFHMGT